MDPAVFTYDDATFRTMFPAYANTTTYPEVTISMYWDMATCYISDNNYGALSGNCRKSALYLMTANLTYIQDLIAAGQIPQVLNQAAVEKVSNGYVPPPADYQLQWWLSSTPYGQQVYALLQAAGVGGLFITSGPPEQTSFRRAYGVFT